jgi:2-polyprenyl-6-methoxyphenol hydroxylase-like FAD-dependent oxidoreductase
MVQIAIIGGGIGGLTAALALRQCGFEPEVFEQAPALLDVGSAIALWPNAARVLDWLQLGDKILERAGVLEEVRWLDQQGHLINHVRIAGERRFPSIALHRADLQHILLQALPESSIHLGHTLGDYQQRGDRMIASFTNGDSIQADFLIAADGVHSRVRAKFINDGDPIERGYNIWRGISPTILSSMPPGTALEVYGRGKRFGIGPIGLGRTGWWATVNKNHAEDLAELFAGWYQPVLDLIETTPPSSILKTGACDRLPVRNWGRGRMTMIGDAIHPTTPNLGQGGCLAMEDAVVLARSFEKYGASEEALRRYERGRLKRTTMVSRYSRYYGGVGQWENVFARGMRRTALALVPEALALRLMQLFFDYDATSIGI